MRVVLAEMRRRERERAAALSRAADAQRQEQHERWIQAKAAAEEYRRRWAEEHLCSCEQPDVDDERRCRLCQKRWVKTNDEDEKPIREAHLPLRKATPAKPKSLTWSIEDRITTHELSISDWCRSFNPDNFPDDFEPPVPLED